ncbi:DUF6979 family protein [Brevibacillus brevis]|uniref:DUF6979 family protein n=1 Tax=Brevibacillus brevis TaxID=1393 RepID=UPI000D0F0E23|nr:hypothetical protein [Brevibacillus brevis]PSJ70235.1 hypothetical protein C7J99_06680 [Brevibacillus brevis]RED30120.1 hypothetical protein DES34_105339 [Brevibacillus brevis]GEC88141.1 hypothetical protein BBR01nite_04720 [Brevibacillus brevis]VEF88667.1 Uncharacterised protein [Brevibacillus brevis]
MGKYGETALLAVKLIESNQAATPQEAWEKASTKLFGAGTYGQKKGCPKGAFLGLCEEGFIRGIEAGKYTKSLDNKAYALRAAALLVKDPTLSQSPSTLWKAINIQKSHNSQMDVVIWLWENNYIVK